MRRAVLARLKADTGLTALVLAGSIYPIAVAQEPTWLFVELGALGTLLRRAVCVNGGRVTIDIHAFAKAPYFGQAMIETAEDHSSRSGAAIEAVFSDRRLALEGGADAHVSLNDIRLLQDDEPDAFDWFAQLTTWVLAT